MATPSIPELPSVDDLMGAAKADLDTARALQQRLLTTQDTLFATALTVAGLFAGLTFSNHSRFLAIVAVPFVLSLALVDVRNWVLFRRVSHRIRSLERFFHAYVVVLREVKTARPQALAQLRRHVDHYQFGTERTLEQVKSREMLAAAWRRLRTYLYLLIAVVMALSGLLWVEPSVVAPPVCIQTAGGIAKVDRTPTPERGTITLVPCPAGGAGH